MRELGLISTNYVLFVIILVLLTSLQCSLWMQLLGSFPPPQTWIPFVVYAALYRRPAESLALAALLTLAATSLSAIPLGLFLMLNLLLVGFIVLFKERIYWPGSTYFVLVCGSSVILFSLLHLSLSWMIEFNPIRHYHLFDWTLGSLLTMLIGFPLYRLLNWIDHLTQKELPTEAGAQWL